VYGPRFFHLTGLFFFQSANRGLLSAAPTIPSSWDIPVPNEALRIIRVRVSVLENISIYVCVCFFFLLLILSLTHSLIHSLTLTICHARSHINGDSSMWYMKRRG
jgi:hypothetical protein